jgi:hypothetical protein
MPVSMAATLARTVVAMVEFTVELVKPGDYLFLGRYFLYPAGPYHERQRVPEDISDDRCNEQGRERERQQE